MNICVYTIAFNGYGQYLPEWLEHIKKQTVEPAKIIIVLGKGHKADKRKLQGAEIIESKSSVMGTLRNLAIKESKTDWLLYFSADDELMPNAIEEIQKKSEEYNVVGLQYIDRMPNGTETPVKSALFTLDDIGNWRNTSVPGYIALKRKYKNRNLYYEDIEIPNYPYLFMLASKRLTMGHTDEICAVYKRRQGSHGNNTNGEEKYKEFGRYIDKRATFYCKEKNMVLVKWKISYSGKLFEKEYTKNEQALITKSLVEQLLKINAIEIVKEEKK